MRLPLTLRIPSHVKNRESIKILKNLSFIFVKYLGSLRHANQNENVNTVSLAHFAGIKARFFEDTNHSHKYQSKQIKIVKKKNSKTKIEI